MIQTVSSPVRNHSVRPDGMEISAVVIHHTGDYTLDSVLNTFGDPKSKASAHYLIDKGGTIYGCVPEERKAWHAGASVLWGREDVNRFSIGIELRGDGNIEPYPSAQLAALELLLRDIVQRRPSVWINRIVGHEHVSPGRKVDPGRFFPWQSLLLSVARFCTPELPSLK